MTKISTKLLCVVLSVAMLIVSLPMYAFAVDLTDDETESVLSEQNTEASEQVIELTDRRSADTKQFKLSDGSYYIAQYTTDVHYLDENGVWQDIDNTLSVSGNEITTSNAKIKFAKKTGGNGSLFTLHDGSYKLELSLDGAEKKIEGRIINNTSELGEDATELQKMLAKRDASRRNYYAHYTGKKWGDSHNYDICLCSSRLGVEACADMIVDLVNASKG